MKVGRELWKRRSEEGAGKRANCRVANVERGRERDMAAECVGRKKRSEKGDLIVERGKKFEATRATGA